MPVYNHRFISNENSEPNPLGMRVAGPTINIEISISQSLAEEFIKNNNTVTRRIFSFRPPKLMLISAQSRVPT